MPGIRFDPSPSCCVMVCRGCGARAAALDRPAAERLAVAHAAVCLTPGVQRSLLAALHTRTLRGSSA